MRARALPVGENAIHIAKTIKVLISCAVTVNLICVFVFTYAKIFFLRTRLIYCKEILSYKKCFNINLGLGRPLGSWNGLCYLFVALLGPSINYLTWALVIFCGFNTLVLCICHS